MRLIDADAFAKYLRENLDVWKHPEALDWAICKLEHALPVDAVPVVHGRWKRGVCNCCHFDLRWLTDGENDLEQWVWDEGFDYCPTCGAKMDLEVDGDG